jgi:hypothetical protein
VIADSLTLAKRSMAADPWAWLAPAQKLDMRQPPTIIQLLLFVHYDLFTYTFIPYYYDAALGQCCLRAMPAHGDAVYG